MKKNLNQTELYSMLTGIFVGCLLISNILAAKTFEVGSLILPCAVIIFPIVYIVNDVLAEIYGFQKTRDTILLGFVINLLAVISYQVAIILPSPSFNIDTSAAFATIMGSTPRILIASFIAYLIGSLLNAKIMQKMKVCLVDKLMLRCVVSTIIGEGCDALLFITIAFCGTMPISSLGIMILAQATFKIVYEIIIYPVTKVVILNVRQLV